MKRILVVFAVLAILMLVGPAASPAAAPASSPPPAPSAVAPAERPPETVAPDELGRGSPRGTVQGFLQATATHDYARAARYWISAAGRWPRSRGPEMARQLRVILDDTRIGITWPRWPTSPRAAGKRACGAACRR